jgi:hypothetical protein
MTFLESKLLTFILSDDMLGFNDNPFNLFEMNEFM